MLAILAHYLWRPWRPAQVLAGVLVVVVIASGMLGIRQATWKHSTVKALTSAPTYITDPRGILNDLNEFDYVFEATSVIGSPHRYHEPAPFQYGKGFWQAVHPFVPGFIDPNKPESRDQEFRKIVWGKGQGEGRPYTIVGDFWNDFGFAGVVVGSVLFGLFSRALLGLVAPAARGPGREYRTILFAMALTLVYIAVSTTYSVTVGFIVVFGLPLVIVLYGIRPATERVGARFIPRAARPGKAPVR
jgi:hypothetical protein